MSQTITLPSSRDRDTGVIMLFLSLVAYYAVPTLANQFGYSHGTASLVSTPIGLILMVLGFSMLFLARKTITAGDGKVRIKDGFVARPLTLRYESTPSVKLSVYEEDNHGRTDQIWTVHLIDDGRQYLVDRRVGQHVAVRSLAENLAKATGGSMVEMHDGQALKFELSELDLPFIERVQKHPTLLGTPVEEPPDKMVQYSRDANGIEVSWSFFRSGLLLEVFLVAACLAGAAFIPLPGGPDGKGFSLYEAERAQQDYRYFAGVAVFTVVSLALLSGYRNRIQLNPKVGAISQSTVWGVPVRTGKIPLSKLENVGISITSRGPYLQLISDEKILREMLPSTHIARWLGWEMRQYLASLGKEQTPNTTPPG
jgi:hypothetical protein